MPIDSYIHQWIVSLTRKTWKIITRIVIILFVIALISFLVFYSRFYIQSLKEESFVNQINCTIRNIKNNTHSCDNQQEKPCQLIIGECFIFNQAQNITLYSTWYDYETTSHQCTVNPCSNSPKTKFYENQSFSSVYWSAYLERGYLNRRAKLGIKITRIIIVLLLSIIILTCLLSIILIVILGVHNKYERIIYPSNIFNSNQSEYIQPPSIIIHKARNDKENRMLMNSELSTQRLVVPVEETLSGSVVIRPHQSVDRKTLEPLTITDSLWTTSTAQHNEDDAVTVKNTVV